MAQLSDARVRTNCLLVLTGAAIIFMLYWLRPVLAPFVVALFVVSGITPVLLWLESRLHVNRLVASILTLALGVFAVGLLAMSFTASAVELGSQAPDYVQRIQNMVLKLDEKMPIGIFDTVAAPQDDTNPNNDAISNSDASEANNPDSDVQSNAADSDSVEPSSPELDADAKLQPIGPVEDPRKEQFAQIVEQGVKESIAMASQWFATSLSTGLIVLIYVAFLIFGDIDKLAQNDTWRVIDKQVRSYIGLKTIVSLVTGFAFGFVLWCFGVPMAVTFGVLAFLLNFIPNIGPLVAWVLPLPFVLLDPQGSIAWMIAVVIVTGGIQLLSGYVVEAKVMGDSANLHPVVILLALVFWGMLWGITGMFLAVPIAAATKIVMLKFRPTKWIANLMAGDIPDFESFKAISPDDDNSSVEPLP